MNDAPLMLGVSGLRGIVGKSLTPEVAARFAGAFGEWLKHRFGDNQPQVVVGRDGRQHGDILHHATISGLMGVGCRVIDLGVATTPTIGVIVDQQVAAGGMVVTASHNPQEWNGLKCLVGNPSEDGSPGSDACAAHATDAAQIIERFRMGQTGATSVAQLGTREERADGVTQHGNSIWWELEQLLGSMWDFPPFKVVLDSVNSSGTAAGRYLLEEKLGCTLTHLNTNPSGVFPHAPEPTRENLVELGRFVGAAGADVGFAQDPDADRLAILDETGRYIGEEYTLVLAAQSLLSSGIFAQRQLPTPTFCVNLSTSRMIDDVATAAGARVVRTAVGEANVVEALKREADAAIQRINPTGPTASKYPTIVPSLKRDLAQWCAFGGEGNGGVIWPRVTYVRDSLSAMALVLALMARTGKKVSELVAAIPAYAIEKRKVELARKEDAKPAVEKIAAAYRGQKIDLQDGVRVDWLDKKAWLHVRASNTEPIMRLIAESPTAAQSRAILDEAARVIAG